MVRGAPYLLWQGGDVHAGIEAYAQRHDWESALRLAQQQGPQMLLRYATTMCSAVQPTSHV